MINENITFENLPLAVSQILIKIKNIELMVNLIPQSQQASDPEPYIYGINGLAKFLQVSMPTAQKIKNSGKIPFSQAERTIIFNKADVLKALLSKKKGV